MTSKPKGTGHGGKRAGAGAKPSAATKFRAEVNDLIEDQLRPILAGLLADLIASGRGLRMVRLGPDGKPLVLPDGEPNVYVLAPDPDVIIYLINRAAGKPIDRLQPVAAAPEDDYVIDLSADESDPPQSGKPSAT